jgi:hypothetical protein
VAKSFGDMRLCERVFFSAMLFFQDAGLVPDVMVENDPYQFYFGQDAQLRTAVEVALNAIKHPGTRPRSRLPSK